MLMDRLLNCVDALRVLARQPSPQANRVRVAEIRINEYLGPDVRALRPALEHLAKAISIAAEEHPNERAFWTVVQEYVGSWLSRLPEE
jgi:hypothetical protein